MQTTITQVGAPEDVRRSGLLAAGLVALAGAALGSALVASPAVSGSPSTDDHCQFQIVDGQWSENGCDRGVRSAP